MTNEDSPKLITFFLVDVPLPAPPGAVLERASAFLQKVGYVPNPGEPLRFARGSAEHADSATLARDLPCDVTLEALADGTGSVLNIRFRSSGDGPAILGLDLLARASTQFPRYFKAERNALIAAAAGQPHASPAELGLLAHRSPVYDVPSAELSPVGGFLGFCAFGAYMFTHSVTPRSFYLLPPLFVAAGGLLGRFVRNWRNAGTRAESAPFTVRYLAAQAARIGSAVRRARSDAPPGQRRPVLPDIPWTTPDTWKGEVMVDASEQDVVFRAAAFLVCVGYASETLPPRIFTRGSTAKEWGESKVGASDGDGETRFTYLPDPHIWQSRIDISAQPKDGRVLCLVLHRAEAVTTGGQPTDVFVGPHAEYWHRERTALLAAVQGRPGPGADDLTAFASAIRLRRQSGQVAGMLTAAAFAAVGWVVLDSIPVAATLNDVVFNLAVAGSAALGWWVSGRVFGAQAEKCVLAEDMSVIRAAWALADAAPGPK